MLFTLLGAMASKHWTAATAEHPVPPRTVTPLAGLSQRSAVEIGSVPLILAQGDGSLIKDIPGRHIVTAIGELSFMGLKFCRAYLSQGNGAFLHIAVQPSKPNNILELRLYQPYHDICPVYQCTAEEAPTMQVTDPALVAPPGTDAELSWTLWLLDNADPMIGGFIGCPVIRGKNTDINPATGVPYEYNRTWVPSQTRITPIETVERITDQSGDAVSVTHRMMHYARPLNSTEGTFEYLLLSAVETPDGASVNYWLGMDVKVENLTIYPAAQG